LTGDVGRDCGDASRALLFLKNPKSPEFSEAPGRARCSIAVMSQSLSRSDKLDYWQALANRTLPGLRRNRTKANRTKAM